MSGLAIEVELLTGAYRAARLDGADAEWPPHPDRLFSALVQAWGDGGNDQEERVALEWLEEQPPPIVEASAEYSTRDAPIVYVPPNDQLTLPEGRRRQARHFRAAHPQSPTLRFLWPEAAPSPQQQQTLASLTSRLASLGHSASLVRVAVVPASPPASERAWTPDDRGEVSLRVAYHGRLDDLERWYSAGERPETRAVARYSAPRAALPPSPASIFGSEKDWIILEGAGGEPDVLALAHVARRLLSALIKLSPTQPAPEVLTGHGPLGGPSTRAHLAVLPLLNVGWEHSDGSVLGVALVMPRDLPPGERQQVLSAVAAFARPQGSSDEATLVARLHLSREYSWQLERVVSPSRESLKPRRWCRGSTTWASVTPVLLDRFPKEDDPAEIATLVAQACVAIGLPEPTEIEVHKHSGVSGSPGSYPARGSKVRPNWSFPADSKLKDRVRRHVVLRFAEPVRGPVVLGAGRYHGFGLCLPTGGAE